MASISSPRGSYSTQVCALACAFACARAPWCALAGSGPGWLCCAATHASRAAPGGAERYAAWDAKREAGLRNSGSVYLRFSDLVDFKYGAVSAVLTLAQGYDLRFVDFALVYGIDLSTIALDQRTSPLYEAIEPIAAAHGAAHALQSQSYQFSDGSFYTPDFVVRVTSANEKQLRNLLKALSLPAPLIQSIIESGIVMTETKCNCRLLSGYDGELLRLLQVGFGFGCS